MRGCLAGVGWSRWNFIYNGEKVKEFQLCDSKRLCKMGRKMMALFNLFNARFGLECEILPGIALRLLSTVWQHRSLNWHWAKSLQTRLMLPANFSKACQKLRGILNIHLRESRTLRLPHVNYVNWAAFWTVAQFLPVRRKKHCCSKPKVQAHRFMLWVVIP